MNIEPILNNFIPFVGGIICLFYGFSESKQAKMEGKKNYLRVKVLFISGFIMLVYSSYSIITSYIK